MMFAAYALVMFVEKASNDLLVESREATARRLRREAYSAFEVTAGVLQDFRLADNGLRNPAEGWGDPLGFAGWQPREGCTAEITFEDESAKLSLPHVDYATFVNAFKAWEVSQVDAEKLADALMTWMHSDYVPQGSTSNDYDRGALPYNVPARSIRSYSELTAIDFVRDMFFDERGRPNPLYQRFVNTFSLFDFKQSNLNAANPDVLMALGQYDKYQLQQVTDFLNGTGAYTRQGPGYFQDATEAANMLGVQRMPQGFGVEISALRVNIAIHEGKNTFRLTVVMSSGSASTVQTTATSSTLSTSGSTSAPSATPTPDATAQTNVPAPADKKLNYPFTILEIRENGEIPPIVAPPPEA